MVPPQSLILFMNRSFWPDVEATGQFLTELCEELAEDYLILVIAGRSHFVKEDHFKPWRFFREEVYKNIRILRVRHSRFWKGNFIGRILNWFTYSLLAFIAAWRVKPRLIVACTDPPFLGIISLFFRKVRGIPFILNCRDLYPDAAVELGKLEKGLLSGLFDFFNRRVFNQAELVIPLGQSMEARIRAKGASAGQIKVIPDWADTSAIQPVSKKDNPLLEKFGLKEKFVIMYSGNIGLSQDFSPILHSVSRMREDSSWFLVFVGEGMGKRSLVDEVRSCHLTNVLFLPYQPWEMLSFSLGMADLHLVPLKRGMAGASVPSKVYGIMAAGRPYLAITDRESEPARLALEFRCGLWAEPGDLEKISYEIQWALNHRVELEEMGKRARSLATSQFAKDVVIKEWFKALKKVAAGEKSFGALRDGIFCSARSHREG